MLKSLNYSKYTKNMNILDIFIVGVWRKIILSFNYSLFAGESETDSGSSNIWLPNCFPAAHWKCSMNRVSLFQGESLRKMRL